MPIPSFARPSRLLLAAAALLLAFGCTLHRANKAFDEGRFDDAVQEYRTVLRNDPSNTKARIGYKRASQRAAEGHLAAARQAESRGHLETMSAEVRKALVLDPDNQIAQDWLIKLEQKAAQERAEADSAEDLELMKAKADATNVIQLNPRTLEGLDLNFSRRTSLREIFAVLSKASGVNILTHTSFQDQTTSIDLRGLPFQRVLDTLMLQNDLFYKVLEKNTIMVFKATPQNREAFENQIIKTYYLSNADPNDLRSTLTTINPQLRVFTDKRVNAIIVKAKPLELAIVDQVIRTLDKAKPEVVVYMELMEVTENSLEQVGLLPVMNATDSSGTYRLGATTVNNTSGMNTNSGFTRIHTSDIRVLFPNVALDFLKGTGDARLVANPNVRVLSGETGEVNIGEKVSTTQSQLSLPTGATGTTASASSLLGGVGQTSFSYENVGVKIKVEPRVHNNGEITLKIDTAITTLKSGSTPGRPDLGIREIKTSARLRDGETAIFGGLLKDEEQKSLQGIWGLSDLPLIGSLLGNTRNSKAKTDVLLTIRAVLVRKPVISEKDMAPFNPEDATSKAGPFTPVASAAKPAQPPAAPTPEAPAKPAAKPATKPAPAPVKPVQATPAQVPAPVPAPPPETQPVPAPPAPQPSDAIQEKKPAGAAEPAPVPSDLVIFMTPVVSEIKVGGKARITLTVSGGKGISSGTLELRIPPGVRLVSADAGDYLSADGGGLETFPAKDGLVKLVFRRSPAGTDSGPFATLDVEGLAPGNAPVLIQSGQFLAGTSPVSGRWQNALVTVQ